ncbi:MAG: hypothetical protein AMDU4_FER2C00080G0001 [Ferroplasma sp. Type II]|nr:MAG: hypothetical protein AMDU4_FER2C00080G0001 [Ferroplasma sp. Type II]
MHIRYVITFFVGIYVISVSITISGLSAAISFNSFLSLWLCTGRERLLFFIILYTVFLAISIPEFLNSAHILLYPYVTLSLHSSIILFIMSFPILVLYLLSSLLSLFFL